ncbi:MAG: hypothetical protein L6E13_09860 [Firmicutes bacterium]|nr:hypothetical protein [Bacillota bacterium]
MSPAVRWMAAALLAAVLGALQATGFLYLRSDTTRISALATLDRSAGFLPPDLLGLGGDPRPLGLPVDNETLEQVYQAALKEAVQQVPAARLSQVGITLVPYAEPPGVVVSLVFYARPQGREFDTHKGQVLEYQWTPRQGGHWLLSANLMADKPELQAPFQVPPWQTQPRWPAFVNRVAELADLSPHPQTSLQLLRRGSEAGHDWQLLVHDGARNRDRLFFLRGDQVLERPDPEGVADLDLLARVFVSAEYLGPRQVLLENAGGEMLEAVRQGRFPDLVGPGTIYGVVLIPISPTRVDAIVHLVGYDGAPYYERLRLERQPNGRWLVTALHRHFI